MIRDKTLPLSAMLILTGCAQQEETGGLPWWGWLLIIVMLIFIFWLLTRGQSRPDTLIKTTPEQQTPVISDELLEEVSLPEVQVNDLTVIEGIGPKISMILQSAGVNTYAQLAAMEPKKIMDIILAAGLRLADTGTWPQQAQLAADGKMEELQAFQDTLKGGRAA